MTEWTPTTCMRCAVGCGHLQRGVDVGYGIDTVRGDADHPVSRGLACQRGIDESANPRGEWLTRPLVRESGELVPTDWNTAIAAVVDRFETALEGSSHGVAVLGSGQQTNEAAYLLGKLARGGFGTRYYDANTTLCMASAVSAYYQAFGSDAPPPTYDDVPEAQTHLVWGANPTTAHPVLYRWIAESADEADSRLVLVDPVETETADDADRHVQLEPGTDLAFARAVLARLVETDAVDRPFVAETTVGFDALVAELPSVETAAATAGVPVEAVEAVAASLADDTLIYWGMGVNQSVQGTATARALIDLCLATGNLGPGSGPFSLTGQANSMGTRVCSATSTWPGHRAFGDPDHRETVADAWDVPLSRLPEQPGPGFVGIVDALALGDAEVCWTVATNPVAGAPNAGQVTAVLRDSFLVVQDAFRTETVELADVVLPAATWGETEGTATNMERRVSRVTGAVEPPGSARQDVDIIAAIGNRLEAGLLPEPPLDPAAVFEAVRELTAGTTADLSGISYDRLSAESAVRWPAPDERTQGGYRYHDDGGWTFETESGLARFSTATHDGTPEPADADYPLVLTTGRRAGAYNTGVRTRQHTPVPPNARVHPETIGEHLGSFDRGRTVVESRRDSVLVSVESDDSVPPGLVWVPIHNPLVNGLTLPEVDPDSGEPNFKQCAVTVRAPPGRSQSPATADSSGHSPARR